MIKNCDCPAHGGSNGDLWVAVASLWLFGAAVLAIYGYPLTGAYCCWVAVSELVRVAS